VFKSLVTRRSVAVSVIAVVLNQSDLPATGLIQPASRVTYRLAVAAPGNNNDEAVRQFTDWAEAQIGFLANIVRLYRGEESDFTLGGNEANAKLAEIFGEKPRYADVAGLCKAGTLKEIEELLEDYSFLRVHHSSLINLNEVTRYVKGEGGYLVMSDGASINVSRSRKESLLKKLQPFRS